MAPGNETVADYQSTISDDFNFTSTMCIKCVVQLGIPDIMSSHGQPITVAELVSALNLRANTVNYLHQVMRLLSFVGLFSKSKIEGEEAYVLAPSSDILLKDLDTKISKAVAAPVKHPLHLWLSKTWQNLGDWFLSQEPVTPFEFANGVSFWDYVNNNPEGQSFHVSMENDSVKFIETGLADCLHVFKGLNSLVDVGGGTGALASSISQAYPELKCTVFDLPKVVDSVAPQARNGSLNYVGGDMFKSIPPADAVLLKNVLHDWNDAECNLILKNCKDAISHKGKEGKLIIIDAIIKEEKEGSELNMVQLLWDVTMTIVFDGQERREKEWKLLLQEAGFNSYKITPLPNERSLIEAFP